MCQEPPGLPLTCNFTTLLWQFGGSWMVYLSKPDMSYVEMTVEELLPESFSPEDLKRKRVHSIPNEC